MDIHKPKPWHSWREFMKELGTIALGVCIALAAEQAVEWWHWQGEVREARKALVAEITRNNSEVMKVLGMGPCLERQTNEAEAILNSVEAGQQPPSFTTFHHEIGIYLSDSEWESERSSQVLTHFPRAELAVMNRYYGQIPILRSLIGPMAQTWTDLSVLRNPPSKLGPDTLVRLRANIDSARHTQTINLFNALAMLNISAEIGVSRPPPQTARSARYCRLDDEQLFDVITKAATQPAPVK